MVNTKGNVSELIFQGAMTWLKPRRTMVLSPAQRIRHSHISQVVPRKVGNAQPTRVPLKPQRPSRPSAFFCAMAQPVSVDTTAPTRAPHATCGVPDAYAPQKMPIRNSSPVQALFWNITCPMPRNIDRTARSGPGRFMSKNLLACCAAIVSMPIR